MKFLPEYTVLTTHTKAAPLVATFKIDKGIITEAGIYFRAGCNHLVHAKLFFQEHQIFPRDQESWAEGNDGWEKGALHFPVDAEPLNVKLVAWSEYCAFDHTITVAIEVLPFSAEPKWQEALNELRRIRRALGA